MVVCMLVYESGGQWCVERVCMCVCVMRVFMNESMQLMSVFVMVMYLGEEVY